MQSKTIGWVLLVVGVLGALGSYSYSYGTVWTVILIIVALAGAWMAFFNGNGGQSPPMQ